MAAIEQGEGQDGHSVATYTAEVEREYCLPPGTLQRLRSQDDWTLVLQAAALVEVACKKALALRFNDPRIKGLLDRLPMEGRVSTTAFLQRLSAIPPKDLTFLRRLFVLRNFYAHDIRRVTMTIEGYAAQTEEGQDLMASIFEDFPTDQRRQLTEANACGHVLWMRTLLLLVSLDNGSL